MNKTVTEHELSQPVVQYASEDFIALRAQSSVAEALECIRSSRTQSAILYEISLQNTLRLAAGMNACLTEGVIRGSGASPLSS